MKGCPCDETMEVRISTFAQVHEWGGVFTDIVTYSHFRQFRPGLRIAINSHGGHYWSTQVCLKPH